MGTMVNLEETEVGTGEIGNSSKITFGLGYSIDNALLCGHFPRQKPGAHRWSGTQSSQKVCECFCASLRVHVLYFLSIKCAKWRANLKLLLYSLAAIILATAVTDTSSTLLTSQPQFILEAEENKAFKDSYLIGTIEIKSGNIAECLKHCLSNCSCMSFQLCQNTTCQLCSTNKIETSSLLHDEDGCIYAIFKIQHLAGSFQVLETAQKSN